MARRYPQVFCEKISGRAKRPHCSCCGSPAVANIEIRVDWFRGNDIVAVACGPHRELASSDTAAFIALAERRLAYLREIIVAQHAETGRRWVGARSALPPRYVEYPR